MKNKEHQKQLERFQKTGELIGKKIICNSCQVPITCFGSNLEGKIKKFGSIENLLNDFKCRSCTSAAKPKKEKKISVRLIKREKKEEQKKLEIPKMKFTVPRNVFLKDAPDLIENCTKNNTCMSPQIYLNNGKSCDGCELFDHCQCTFKSWRYARA